MKQRNSNKQSGIAILSSLIFLAIVVVMLGIGTVVGLSNFRLSKDNKATIQAQHAADAAIERAIYEFWHVPNYLAEFQSLVPTGSKLSIATYKRILSKEVDVGQSMIPIYPGPDESTYGNSVSISGQLDNGSSYEAVVQRKDIGNRVLFNIVSKGMMDSAERYVTQTLSFGSENPWDFAILTDNIECIFCHLEVYSMEAGYKADGTLRNFFTDSLADIHGFERVRVGSISKLELSGGKHQEADSYILGSVYARETSNFVSGKSEIYTVGLQPDMPIIETGNNFASSFKRLDEWDSAAPLNTQDCASEDCVAFGKLYTHYPTEDIAQPDGLLQSAFPLPVTDDDANRIIDNNEWDNAVAGGGSLSVRQKGTVNNILTTTNAAGIIVVDKGRQLGDVTLSDNSFASSKAKSSLGGQHLILRGVADNPIVMDGKVYVNGDVVISGRVAGDGMIIARGNVYIVGDIVYDCGRSDCDYSKPDSLPRFALAAIGNITSGIYSSPSHSGSYDPTLSPKTLSETLTYNESADTPTTRFVAQDYGTLTRPTGGRDHKNGLSLAGSQLFTFNHSEYQKASNDSTYIPRFYIYRQGEHDWLQSCNSCWTHQGGPQLMRGNLATRRLDGGIIQYNGADVTQNIAGTTSGTTHENILKRAVYISLSPEDHWTLGGYTIEEPDFNTQFPSAGGCNPAKVDKYINEKLFNLKLNNAGEQKQGAHRVDDVSSPDTCYDIAVARERLRAMNSELVLRKMWKTYVEDAGARTDMISVNDGNSFRFDGIIYTGNAFFFLSPATSVTQGEALVNGSFIAADMGVLVGGTSTIRHNSLMHSNPAEQNARGLRIHYDRRAIGLISDTGEGVGLAKSSFEVMSVNDAKQYFGGP